MVPITGELQGAGKNGSFWRPRARLSLTVSIHPGTKISNPENVHAANGARAHFGLNFPPRTIRADYLDR